MEADWSAEIGPELPQIALPWEGFVDLRLDPAQLHAIPEAARFPALARVLTALNSGCSTAFTVKSDVWGMAGAEIDPDEFSALPADARCGVASYIDLLEWSAMNFASFVFHERRARELVDDLRVLSLPNGRVDLVIRAAAIDDREGYGLTLYAAGCGSDAAAALANWESVLNAAVLATMRTAGFSPSPARFAGE
jgi:hypothetical protein